ncbi:MAG: hypothetical protein ABGY10_06200, partial [bacterium]
DNVADLLGHIGFSSCKIVGPVFKSTGGWKRKMLIHGLEAFNAIAGVIGKGFWPTMQVMARKKAQISSTFPSKLEAAAGFEPEASRGIIEKSRENRGTEGEQFQVVPNAI